MAKEDANRTERGRPMEGQKKKDGKSWGQRKYRVKENVGSRCMDVKTKSCGANGRQSEDKRERKEEKNRSAPTSNKQKQTDEENGKAG